MRAAEAEGQALDERWHLRKGGERFWANGLVMPLKDDADQTRGFLKIIRDMTEQKKLEEALQKRTADLERADAQKNEFLAMLAHELRNPLAAIRNAVTVSALSKQHEHLDWSREVITRQVRNFRPPHRRPPGRLPHHGRQDPAPQGTHRRDPHRPKRHRGRETAHRAAEHELLLSFTSTDLRLEADPVRLEQILVNLLTNAAKYTPAGGRIQLIVGVEGREVLFRVRDNGVGIPPESLPRMFDLFAQGDRSLARSEGGLGIGLTLVKSLAEMHGGTVTATSDGPGKGSEFVVRLPAASATSPGPARFDGRHRQCGGPTLAGARRR